MAGFDKLIFLFKDNEKIDVNKTSVSFVFGNTTPPNPTNPNIPCYPNPYIDPEKNTFTFDCGCTTISYEDNTFKQNCIPPPLPDCTTDLYFDPDTTTFKYNCICDARTDSNDFLIDCTTTGGGSGDSIDFGILINSYGIGSNTTFSVDIYGAESNVGILSDAIVNVADMRLSGDFLYGQKLDVALFKYTYLDNDFTFGHYVNTLISFDDQNYFTGDLNLAIGQQFDASLIFNPYHEFDREITSVFGHSANTLIIFDIHNPFVGEVNYSFDYDIKTFIVFDDNKFDREYSFNFGHEVSTRLIYDDNKFTSNYNFNYAYDSNVTVTFDNGNNFESVAYAEYGYSSDTFVLFAYPSPFQTDVVSEYGHHSDTLMTFGAPNPFPTIIVSEYGYSVNATLIVNLFENIVEFNKTIDLGYGHSVDTFVIFNVYNPLLKPENVSDAWYGTESYATMRYSDDPYINDIEYKLGIASDFDLDVQIGLYTFDVDFPYGVDTSDSVLEYTIGLSGTVYYGIMSRILYVSNLYTPVYFDAIMAYGHMMHYNEYDVRKLDLLRKPCCTFHRNDLKIIEMNLEPNYGRQWMDWDMFNYKVDIQFTTQPRFSTTMTLGVTSDIVDSTSYFSVDFIHGTTANVRTMNFDSVIDLVGGNFIVDQNEIKVEMTKPEDIGYSLHAMTFGFYCRSSFSIQRVVSMDGVYGINSTFDIWYDSPLRPNGYYGYQVSGSFATTYNFDTISCYGATSTTTLYEPPYEVSFGFYSDTSQLYTENFVEFLEDGEVNNEYIHQNKNGDTDHAKPNGQSIEGYVYTHYIKGRCY